MSLINQQASQLLIQINNLENQTSPKPQSNPVVGLSSKNLGFSEPCYKSKYDCSATKFCLSESLLPMLHV